MVEVNKIIQLYPRLQPCFVALLYFTQCLHAFNLDAEFPSFSKGPIQNSYFGYDIDYYSDSAESWIIVGAPKANANGEVYKCQYDPATSTLSPCKAIYISKEHSSTPNQMLGSTVTVGLNKQLLSCAPQFTQTSRANNGQLFYDLVGVCYLSADFTDSKPTTYRYTPCIANLGQNHYGDQHSYCQAGFSAAFTKDKSKILLGAVGSYYNQGSIMLISDDLYRNISTLPIHTAEFKPAVPENWTVQDYYRQTFDGNYMGYSVDTGTTGSNLALLVTSAPRRLGFDLRGTVTVYDEDLSVALANFTGQQIGEYFGQGLAVVDVNGDNLDDVIVGSPLYTDVTRKEPEIGRIYVYYQQSEVEPTSTKRHLIFSEPLVINGNASMGRFGSTITSLGDINDDGYKDILVSAPYERNATDDPMMGDRFGALYVFNGGPDGLREHPSQVINGANLEETPDFKAGQQIRGLGYSLKGGRDLDGNGYPDVIAGSYLSDQVAVIRARPVVKLIVSSKIKPNKVDLETLSCDLPSKGKAACFRVDSCFSYSGKNLPPSVKLSYSYDVDSSMPEVYKRAYLLDSSARNITVVATETLCVNEIVYMKRDIRDKLSAIAVTVSYWLRETQQPVEPVLNLLAGTSVTTEAEIFKDCGADEVCIPSLKLESLINPQTAIVGAYTEILMTSTVSNSKDNAYQTLLVVRYPDYVTYIGVQEMPSIRSPINCINANQSIICEIGNPMKSKTQVTVNLKFGINDLLGDLSELIFESLANCTNEQSFVSNKVQSRVAVQVEANIQIYNVSTPNLISLEKLSKDLSKNTTASQAISHTYEITNVGPSTLNSATISLLWPLKLNGRLLLGLDEVVTSGEISCNFAHIVNESLALSSNVLVPSSNDRSTDSSQLVNYYNCHSVSDSCFEMKCNVDRMEPKSDVLITLKGSLMLAPLLESSVDSIITSSLVFDIMEYPYEIKKGETGPYTLSEVSTSAVYRPVAQPTSIQWWIIAVSVAAGVLFLIIIILVLWKCGFFKRKTPPTEDDQVQQQKLYRPESDSEMVKEKDHLN